MKIKKQEYYNKKYFIDRDSLCMYQAQPLLLFANENKYKKILDVGAGTGKLVNYLNKNNKKALGIDKSPIATKYPNVKKGDAIKIPYKLKSFDLVTGISIIEHLSEKESNVFLKEAYRVLNDNGSIFLITPNWSNPLRYLRGKKWFAYQDPTHTKYYSPSSLKIMLIQAGFKNINFAFKVSKDTPFDWPFPKYMYKLPKFIKYLINYLLISSPCAKYRDSFWVSAIK